MPGPPYWPRPMPPATRFQRPYWPRQVNISRLSPADKRRVWMHMQQSHPALAELLGSQQVREIVEAFEARVMVDREVLDGLD